jgi:hypothetical protein
LYLSRVLQHPEEISALIDLVKTPEEQEQLIAALLTALRRQYKAVMDLTIDLERQVKETMRKGGADAIAEV